MISTDYEDIVSNLPVLCEYREEVRDRQRLSILQLVTWA